MIRKQQNPHAVALRIAEVLKSRGEDWVEEVLRLLGDFHAARAARAPRLEIRRLAA